MTLKEGDTVSIDGVDYEVNSATPQGYGFAQSGASTNYFWFVFKTKEEVEALYKAGRLIPGTTERIEEGDGVCSWHSWKKYVGLKEVYHFCTNCGAKRFISWTQIKNDREY